MSQSLSSDQRLVPSTLPNLKPTPLRRPRERNALPHILLPSQQPNQPLPPHPETTVSRRSVPPEVDVPLVRFGVEVVRFHRFEEGGGTVFAERTAGEFP